MGRGKFGPQLGPWVDDDFQGPGGDNPPFHTPVFVLTHHPRASMEMEGGTTFHFIDAGPTEALEVARVAAKGLHVHVGGGPSTLQADLIDHMHIAVVPIVLGRGERLWTDLEGLEDRFKIESMTSPSGTTHHLFTRR